MKGLRIVLALIVLPSTAQALELCEGRPRSIEPDMQIQEANLSSVAARQAVADLRDLLREESSDHVTQLGILNRLQVLEGYALRQRALEDWADFGESSPQTQTSTDEFCAWMDKGAFWYD